MEKAVCSRFFVTAILVLSLSSFADSGFTRSGSVITDNATGLEWRIGPDDDTNWESANEWVESLGSTWRMPTMSELESLHNSGITARFWGFFQNSGSFVWSIETEGSSACYFSFEAGGEYTGNKLMRLYFRAFAVR